MGKDGGGGGSTFDYFGTIAGAVCAGPVKSLLAFEVDGKIVWPKAEPWAAATYPPGSVVLHEGRFYTTASSTSATPPSAPWTIYKLTNASRNSDGYTAFTVEGYGPQNNARFYWGFANQAADSVLVNPAITGGEIHPPYLNVAYFVLIDFLAGRERQSFPTCAAIVEVEPVQAAITGTAAQLNDGQANPAAIAASLVENRTDSLGLSSVTPDASSFQSAADDLLADTSKSYVSGLFDKQTTIRDIAVALGEESDLWLRPDNDVITAGRWSRSSSPTIALQVTPDMWVTPPKLVSQGWDSAATGINFRFPDRTRNYKQSGDKVDELRAYAIIREHRRKPLDLSLVTRAEQARTVAIERLRKRWQPRVTGDLSLRRPWGLTVKPGQFIELDVDLEPNGTQALLPFKVLERVIPSSGPIKFKIESDATQWPVFVTPADETPAFGFAETVEAFADVRFIDAPLQLGGGDFSAVIPLVARPNKRTIGFTLLHDSDLDLDSDFEDIGTFNGFAVKASLSADLAIDALSDAATLPIDATPSASVLRLSVADQTDRDIFMSAVQPGAVGSADDKLLLVLVQKSGDYAAETSDGLARVEVLSVEAWEAYGSGEPKTYAVKALRARRGTLKNAFTAANAEAWLIWRDSVASAFHADFRTIRSNREQAISGSVQDFRLRLQPFTPTARRPASQLTSINMRFPLAAPWRPRLKWETESPAWPYTVPLYTGGTVRVRGTWRDNDGDLVSYSLSYRAVDATEDVLLDSKTLAGQPLVTFDRTLTLPGNAATDPARQFIITARAIDATGLSTEVAVEAVVPAGPSAGRCETPALDVVSLSYGLGIANLVTYAPPSGTTVEYTVRPSNQLAPSGEALGTWTPVTFASWTGYGMAAFLVCHRTQTIHIRAYRADAALLPSFVRSYANPL